MLLRPNGEQEQPDPQGDNQGLTLMLFISLMSLDHLIPLNQSLNQNVDRMKPSVETAPSAPESALYTHCMP